VFPPLAVFAKLIDIPFVSIMSKSAVVYASVLMGSKQQRTVSSRRVNSKLFVVRSHAGYLVKEKFGFVLRPTILEQRNQRKFEGDEERVTWQNGFAL
jgi:hypothetical protein